MKALALCGLVLVITDVLVTIGLGALNPGYSHLRQFISELGEAGRPLAWLFALWSVIYGMLFAAFTAGLARSLKGQPGAPIGTAALYVIAITSAVDGVFPCDPGCSGKTVSGLLHIAAGAVSLVAIAVGPFFIARAMATSGAWPGYRALTIGAGCSLCALGTWLALCFLFGITPAVEGAVQRALLLVLYAWIASISVRLWRLAGSRPT
jgi:hypothetical membrane protein